MRPLLPSGPPTQRPSAVVTLGQEMLIRLFPSIAVGLGVGFADVVARVGQIDMGPFGMGRQGQRTGLERRAHAVGSCRAGRVWATVPHP